MTPVSNPVGDNQSHQGTRSGTSTRSTPAPRGKATTPKRSTPWARAGRRFIRQPAGVLGLSILATYVVAAVVAPWLAPYDPLALNAGDELVSPSATYLLGTDELGRDILSRIIFGARTSLLVGVLAVAVGASVGGASGLVSGYVGGWSDATMMRGWDAVFAVPAVMLGIAVAAVLGAGSSTAAIALGIASMPIFARITRAVVISEKQKEYVSAAIVDGASHTRIMIKHIFPNAAGPLLVQLALTMTFSILVEAALSFIGLGAQAPAPSWGRMLAESRSFLHEARWYAIFPGLAITTLVVGLNFIADALRDAFDPRSVR